MARREPDRSSCPLNKSNPAMELFGRCLRHQVDRDSPVFYSSKLFLSFAHAARTISSSSHVAHAFWAHWALWHTWAPSCAQDWPVKSSVFLLESAEECDGFRYKMLSAKKSFLANLPICWVATLQTTFLVYFILHFVFSCLSDSVSVSLLKAVFLATQCWSFGFGSIYTPPPAAKQQ